MEERSPARHHERNQPERNQPERNQPERNQAERHQVDRYQPERHHPIRNQPERNQPERNQAERHQVDRYQPERHHPIRNQPERNQPERNQPERNQPERYRNERNQPERNQPERYRNERNQPEILDIFDDDDDGEVVCHKTIKGPALEALTGICPQPPYVKPMEEMPKNKCIFMIRPFKYDPASPPREIPPLYGPNQYGDIWDEHHVRMPCSPLNISDNGQQQRWPIIQHYLTYLRQQCKSKTVTVEDLKRTISVCSERSHDIYCLERLINEIYTKEQKEHFLYVTLQHMCSLAINVDTICSRPPVLLRAGSNRSITMSQLQAASLLACSFFCIFPYRSDPKTKREYDHFQNPNFTTLYQYHHGNVEKTEKLKCILNYFQRVTTKPPIGVITFRRFALSEQFTPKWSASQNNLAPMHATTAKKIEDINCVLHVDFANRYIGGGVLGAGCVQEEIRFSLCPEMLVSLLVCEAMQPNECIYLIGCERYSNYKGYAKTFQFAGDHTDNRPRDNWGRKWCHLVAIDAIHFPDPSIQYDMKFVKRELIKAFAGFHIEGKPTANNAFPVATGNWGCGAFNGDRQLKAIIQLIAASEAVRPLIYAAYGDKKLVETFAEVYDYLIGQRAGVKHLYRYLQGYSKETTSISLFNYILRTPITTLKS